MDKSVLEKLSEGVLHYVVINANHRRWYKLVWYGMPENIVEHV